MVKIYLLAMVSFFLLNKNCLGQVSGPATVCFSDTVLYSVNVSGASTFAWQVPLGTQILQGQDNDSILVKFGSNSGNITVTPNIGSAQSLSIAVNALPNVGVSMMPPNGPCMGNSVSLTGTGASQYQWSNGVQNNVPFSTGGLQFADPSYFIASHNNGALEDLDGDGIKDMILLNNGGLQIYRNLGLGGNISMLSFAPPIAINPFIY
ncbi:MAG: hypothetical protein SGJ00_07520 [bacterium]|nr:hypothetical protein [bacterium]